MEVWGVLVSSIAHVRCMLLLVKTLQRWLWLQSRPPCLTEQPGAHGFLSVKGRSYDKVAGFAARGASTRPAEGP